MLKPTHIHTSLAITGAGILAAQYVASKDFSTITTPAFDIPLFTGVVFGATIPDIDHSSTKINRIFGNFGKWFAQVIGHRTWTHTIWAIILWFIIAFLITPHNQLLNLNTPNLMLANPLVIIVWGIAIGNLLHILEDNCSMQGVLFLYPFTRYETSNNGHPYKKRKWSFARYKTGSGAENAINIFMIALFLLELWRLWHIWFIK